jgi:hypothetical protein
MCTTGSRLGAKRLIAHPLTRFPQPSNYYAAMSLRERTRPGLGIIEPCLPSPAKAPPSGPGWLHEIKRDVAGMVRAICSNRLRCEKAEPYRH